MALDQAGKALAAWRRERPELELGGAAVMVRIRRAASLVEEQVADSARSSGIRNPGDLDTLAALRREGEPFEMSPKELASLLLVTSAGLSGRLDRLERAGWVERRANPDDRRATIVALTSTGRELIDEVYALTVALYDRALGHLDAAERETLADLLRRILIDLGDS